MLEDLKKDNFAARKEKNTVKANLLSTVIAEAAMVGKNDGNREPTADETLSVIKKFVKGLNESIENLKKIGRETSKEEEEKSILESYLPSQLGEEKLEKIVKEIVSSLGEKSPQMMGTVMGKLKEGYANQFDGKIASQVVRKVLGS